MEVWCGSFESFERYSPYGTPTDVAEFLVAYTAAGCTSFNLIPQSPDVDTAVEGAAEVKRKACYGVSYFPAPSIDVEPIVSRSRSARSLDTSTVPLG